ncbi:Folate transporter 1, partial [Opisthocomus hoazin]
GAIASFTAGYVKIRWKLWSELVIGMVTAFQAGLLLLMNTTSSIWLCYAAYVLFRGSYQFLVPIATFQISASLSKELCALVFGVNTFLATVLKTIITIIVADKRGLGLSVHPQFYVYFGYFTVLAVVYLLAAV